MREQYLEGYLDALQVLDHVIVHNVKANKGARMTQGVINVYNAVIAHINHELISLQEELEQSEKLERSDVYSSTKELETLINIVESIFSEIGKEK